MKEMYTLIKEHRSMWLDGFAEPDESEDLEDYLLRVVEANIAMADEELKETPADEVKRLAEVARGVKTLNAVMQLMRQGKMAEAMKLLQNWIAVYPVSESGSSASRRMGFYSFPYSSAQTGSPGAGKLKPYGEAPPRRESVEDETKEKEEKVLGARLALWNGVQAAVQDMAMAATI